MELYEFQSEDVEKIVRQKSALIASEMGTGKTHEAIALDELWYKRKVEVPKPTLIVAPINTFPSWQEKYSIQSPESDVTTIDRKNRDRFVDQIRRRRGDVFLMHWDALRLMPELREVEFNLIVADEVHRASNRKAQATLALKKLRTVHKLGMSGTASGDKPEGLWSINHWLWPEWYRSYWRFRKHYCVEELVGDPSDRTQGYRKIVGVKNAESLRAEMDPWYVRHLKKEQCCDWHPEGVMPWLPDKFYSTLWVELNPTQRKFYEQMRKEMVAWVNEHEDSPLVASVVVAQMTRLSQMALATPSIDESTGRVRLQEPSSKIDAVKELIEDHAEKQFVVWSSSKQAVYLAQQAFERAGITSEVLSGDTPQAQRDGMVAEFGRGGYQVFLGVIQAGGEGVDGLQGATDTCIFLDRSWSTIKNKQAEDRLHRGGSEVHDNIHVIDVVARDTLDWGRHQKLNEKWNWIKSILGDVPAVQASTFGKEYVPR